MKLNYGSILKMNWLGEEETVMLINNFTFGNEKHCCVLDLQSKEILFDCKDTDEFIKEYGKQIIKIEEHYTL